MCNFLSLIYVTCPPQKKENKKEREVGRKSKEIQIHPFGLEN